MNLFENDYTPEHGRMSPEAEEVFGLSRNLVKARKAEADTEILSDVDRTADPSRDGEVISLDDYRNKNQPTMLDEPDDLNVDWSRQAA